MATLEERIIREEGRGEQFDKRLEALSVEMRSGFDSSVKPIEAGFERTDRSIEILRKLLITSMITIITGLTTIVNLLLIAVINLLS